MLSVCHARWRSVSPGTRSFQGKSKVAALSLRLPQRPRACRPVARQAPPSCSSTLLRQRAEPGLSNRRLKLTPGRARFAWAKAAGQALPARTTLRSTRAQLKRSVSWLFCP
jgi:hypothetical protein